MSSKQPSFHDRADLSDLEMDPDLVEATPSASSEALVPIPDTGVRPIKIMGRETRSLKRAQERTNEEESLPKGKRSKTCSSEDMKVIILQQQKQGETLQEILKELRNLTACVDNLRTTVTNKMTTMETKLSVQQDRIQSLQTARRDGFMSTLTLDTSQSTPLPSTPHYVAQPPPNPRQPPPQYGPSTPNPSPLDSLGF